MLYVSRAIHCTNCQVNYFLLIFTTIPMLSSYISWHLLLVISGSAKQQCLTPSSSVDGRCLVSILYVCLHLCALSVSLLHHSSSNLVVQMECCIFFVSYRCNNVRSPTMSLLSVDDPNWTWTRTNNRRFLS